MRAAPTTTGQSELFDVQPPVDAARPDDPDPRTDAPSRATAAVSRPLRRGPGGPGRVILRPARRSIDVLDRPALEALCHAFGLSVVGERDEVLRDRLSTHLRCR